MKIFKRKLAQYVLILATGLGAICYAKTPESKKIQPNLPGDTSLPSSKAELDQLAALEIGKYSYSVEDFFTTPKQLDFKESPDGKYLSYLQRNESGSKDLWIKNNETEKTQRLVVGGKDLIEGYEWANNNQIVFVKDQGGDENTHIFSVSINDPVSRDLTPFPGVKALLARTKLDNDAQHIIIVMNKDNPAQLEPYLLNIDDGKLKKLYTNDNPDHPIVGYSFDTKGTLRSLEKTSKINSTRSRYYFFDGEFQKIKDVQEGETYSIIHYLEQSEHPDEAYVLSNLDSDKIQAYRENLKTGHKTLLFSNDTYDVGDIAVSKKRKDEIDYFAYEGERQTIKPVSDTFKYWQKNVTRLLGNLDSNTEISLINRSRDEHRLLFAVYSDKIAGRIYEYIPEHDTLTLIADLYPNLKVSDMASMIPIEFISRDGVTIHGYFTRPAAPPKKDKLPLVVIPHGGPQGKRDSWGFSRMAQLLASRGYATLFINFRISGGYGKKFQQLGYGQIGRKVMDDIEDGLQYVIEKGWVDKDKVAIFGASHGGYAVLRALTKTPDLYQCGIDYVGISNIFTFLDSIPPYWESMRKSIETIWYNPKDPEQRKIMEEISPALHVERITKPLFIIQGANDPRVSINESDQMVKALRQRGIEVPYMVKYDEGHGFNKEHNKIESYKAMLGFLSSCLK